MSVKSLGTETARRIVSQRAERPYADLADFLDRVRPDEEEARALVLCGACDSLQPGRDRAGLLWDLAAWRHRQVRRSAAPTSLFDEAEAAPPVEQLAIANCQLPIEVPVLPEGTELDRLRQEYDVLDFLCDRHPMVLYADMLPRWKPVKAADLARHVGQGVRCAGWRITGKIVSTRQGEAMEFITFEDETGTLETVFFPDAYRRYWHLLQGPGPFVLAGRVEEEFGAVTLTVNWLTPLGRVSRTARLPEGTPGARRQPPSSGATASGRPDS